ncbi:hypothetical protein L218DRAFT_951316 [Marasmius fiardii PR-910]|nr:hypothetical protein L218DRAFT_951316 [Marasmius fiardii PR-910]
MQLGSVFHFPPTKSPFLSQPASPGPQTEPAIDPVLLSNPILVTATTMSSNNLVRAAILADLNNTKQKISRLEDQVTTLENQKAVRKCTDELMGIPTGTKDLPPYPKEECNWPLHPTSNKKLLCFHWVLKWKDEPNWSALNCITKYVKEKGAVHIPAAKDDLEVISNEDLFNHVKVCFNELASIVKKALVPAEDEVAGTQMKKKQSSAIQTHQKGISVNVRDCQSHLPLQQKLKIRSRKYDALPDNNLLKDRKYKVAMAYTLMSEDKDSPNPNEYRSRKLNWWSDMAHNFYMSLDVKLDPNPGDKATNCIHGDLIESHPRLAKDLKLCTRWSMMIGRLWGDKDDPGGLLKRMEDVKAVQAAKRKSDGDGGVNISMPRAQVDLQP